MQQDECLLARARIFSTNFENDPVVTSEDFIQLTRVGPGSNETAKNSIFNVCQMTRASLVTIEINLSVFGYRKLAVKTT